jgi:hypothetical protein
VPQGDEASGLWQAALQAMQCCASHAELLCQSIQSQLCDAHGASAESQALPSFADADPSSPIGTAARDDSSPGSVNEDEPNSLLFQDSPQGVQPVLPVLDSGQATSRMLVAAQHDLMRTAACLCALVDAVLDSSSSDMQPTWARASPDQPLPPVPCLRQHAAVWTLVAHVVCGHDSLLCFWPCSHVRSCALQAC